MERGSTAQRNWHFAISRDRIQPSLTTVITELSLSRFYAEKFVIFSLTEYSNIADQRTPIIIQMKHAIDFDIEERL